MDYLNRLTDRLRRPLGRPKFTRWRPKDAYEISERGNGKALTAGSNLFCWQWLVSFHTCCALWQLTYGWFLCYAIQVQLAILGFHAMKRKPRGWVNFRPVGTRNPIFPNFNERWPKDSRPLYQVSQFMHAQVIALPLWWRLQGQFAEERSLVHHGLSY